MKIPEIVLTSTARSHKDDALLAGANQFLQKLDLMDYMRPLKGRVIAYVDDNPVVRDSTESFLSHKNTVHMYSSAEEALKAIPDLEPPVDLVISDVEMPPGMNGIAFIQELLKLCEA